MPQKLKVLAWGTYDLSKPRVRILLQALSESDVELTECHADVWGGTADKSQIKGVLAKLRFIGVWLLAYPRLLWCLFRGPKPDVIFVGYLGQFDVLVLWPFARLMGIPVAWDAFISLYNTVVEDRKMVGPRHPLALFLYAVEWLATRAADRVILDTRAHADYFVDTFGVVREKTDAVFVGAETDKFIPASVERDPQQPFTVLFYGQFIPLHGIPTIIEAARLLQAENIHWVIIGKGQEEQRIACMLEEQPLERLKWIPWVTYEELNGWIGQANVCLGIFDDGEKASRVIPNKVYQILAAGRPLITRDSDAIRELISTEDEGIWLVEPENPEALSKAVVSAFTDTQSQKTLHTEVAARFSLKALGQQLIHALYRAYPNHS